MTIQILAGRLIDGSGGQIRRDVLLTIENGIFSAIEPFDRAGVLDQPLTDLSFATLCPPFVDCHAHLAFSGTIDPQERKRQAEAPYSEIRPLIARHISYLFGHGVLAVRDAGDRQGFVRRYLHDPSAGPAEPVIVRTTGRAWHRNGRYGGMIGRCPGLEEELDTAYGRENEEIDHVKVINSGPNSLREFARQTPPQFSLEELRRVVEMAGRAGRKVMVHANGRLPVRLALEAGCQSIEHGYFMGRENLQYMAEKGTVLVPTLQAMKACADNATGPLERRVAAKNLAHQLAQVALARELGVKVALGTDAGSPGVLHGESVVEEMKLLVKAGYSLSEAIRCATCNGAQLLGIDAGLIAVGKPAHFLVARGTPAQLPRKFSYLEAIYRYGRPCPLYRKNPRR